MSFTGSTRVGRRIGELAAPTSDAASKTAPPWSRVEPPSPTGQRRPLRQATILADVRESMTIAQEEIFGPMLCIMPYDSDEDAIRIANQSIYGRAGSVWSADSERAKRVARRMRAGQVDIDGAKFNPLAPFGGCKQSGHGRELGTFGFEEYLELKSLQL